MSGSSELVCQVGYLSEISTEFSAILKCIVGISFLKRKEYQVKQNVEN
jgi:hypothetical protein